MNLEEAESVRGALAQAIEKVKAEMAKPASASASN
jgi:hypothetical protein